MANKACPNCGSEIIAGIVNCPQCGERVAEPKGQLVFICVAVIIVGGLMAQDSMDRENSLLREPLKRVRA